MLTYYWKLLLKHKTVLLTTPMCMALVMMLLIWNQEPEYQSTAVINTGFASGMSLESLSGSRIDYMATNSSFDNLINITRSRATQEEVSIRLLASHLQMQRCDVKQITPLHFQSLKEMVPEEVNKLVTPDPEQTVANLYALKNSSRDNFVLNILSHSHPHYSISSLERVQARRLADSDLLEISYQTDDPGICRQTLVLFLQVILRNFRASKASSSNDVVAYFEEQLKESVQRLGDVEDRYASFNKANRIINYYEETKSIAIHKDNFSLSLQDEKMNNAGAQATLRHLEAILPRSDLALLQSQSIIAKRNELAGISAQIASAQVADSSLQQHSRLADLYARSNRLKSDLHEELAKLQTIGHTLDNLPTPQILEQWLENAIRADEAQARIKTLEEYKKEFDKYYDAFSPLGARIKRFEREIGVLESANLELLHSLTLAKLKQQDVEIASQLRILDEPNFPLEPKPRSAKKMLILALFSGLMLASGFIVLADYFSAAVKNPERARRLTGLEITAVTPLANPSVKDAHRSLLYQKSIDFLCQQIDLKRRAAPQTADQPFFLLLCSAENDSEMHILARDLARRIDNSGNRMLLINDLAKGKIEALARDIEDQSQAAGGRRAQTLAGYDYLLLEMPAIKTRTAQWRFFNQVNYALLLCRSDHSWTRGDEVALANLRGLLPCDMQCVLYAADEWECRQWLGIHNSRGSGLIATIINFFKA